MPARARAAHGPSRGRRPRCVRRSTLPVSSYHAGIWWPHQSWREMHQSWMLSIQCVIGRQPFRRHELARSPVSPVRALFRPSPTAARQRSWIVLPGKNGCVAGAGLRHRDEPLVGQHRLDDLARAPAARHDHPVRLFAHDEALLGEIGEHRLARRHSDRARDTWPGAFSLIVASRFEDRQRRELVPLADLPVVEVVRRRDLDRAGAEFPVDVGIGDDGNRAARERQRDCSCRPDAR